ncbi:MAG: hypothetical protein KGR46_05185 [Verrucomicrobia bacterium]|nr:hypothetical protein [Verrucomicrobiota bacterium]
MVAKNRNDKTERRIGSAHAEKAFQPEERMLSYPMDLQGASSCLPMENPGIKDMMAIAGQGMKRYSRALGNLAK